MCIVAEILVKLHFTFNKTKLQLTVNMYVDFTSFTQINLLSLNFGLDGLVANKLDVKFRWRVS